MVSIRPRVDADLEGCIHVLHDVYARDGYPVQGMNNAKAFLTSGPLKRAWVAEREGRVIGHVAVSQATDDDVSVALWRQQNPNDAIAVLGRLFVGPDERAGGVASRLMGAAVEWSREANVRLVMFALVKDQAAMRLYERLGWQRFGSRMYRYGEGQQMEAVCYSSP